MTGLQVPRIGARRHDKARRGRHPIPPTLSANSAPTGASSTLRARPADLPGRSQERVIVGLDAEWVADGPHNKVLSYQLVVLNADTGKMSESYFQLDGRTSRRPKALGWLIAKALRQAIVERVIKGYPNKLTLAIHFARADLSVLEDFDALKHRLTALRKTYSTTDIPLVMTIATGRGARKINITVTDTMLLAPAKTRLEELGEHLKVPKIELPAGYTKDRMDLFQADRPEEFRAYAMRDAKIAALWTARVFNILVSLGIKKPVATLAAAAVDLIKREIKKYTELNAYLGKDKARRGKPRVKTNLVELWSFAAQTYHGGLNNVFSYGYSPKDWELSTSTSRGLTRRGWRWRTSPTGPPPAGQRTSTNWPSSTRR